MARRRTVERQLVEDHGVLAANAAWRKRAVAYGRNATLSTTARAVLGRICD